MRGRDQFARHRKAILFFAKCLALFPVKTRKKFLERRRRTPGKLGMLLRYAALKSVAASCGDNVAIHENAYILNPQNLRIGDNVSIQPMCYLECGKSVEEGLCVGDDVRLAHGVTLMATSHQFDDPTVKIADRPAISKRTSVGNDVWIGAKATVVAGVSIGNGCVVGANSVVTKDVPDNKVVVGAPARVIKDRG